MFFDLVTLVVVPWLLVRVALASSSGDDVESLLETLKSDVLWVKKQVVRAYRYVKDNFLSPKE